LALVSTLGTRLRPPRITSMLRWPHRGESILACNVCWMFCCPIGIVVALFLLVSGRTTEALAIVVLVLVAYVTMGLPAAFFLRRPRGPEVGDALAYAEKACPAFSMEEAAADVELGEQICVICLDGMCPGHLCRRLNCGHCFHADCVDAWWRKRGHRGLQPLCPMCRRSATGSMSGDAGGGTQSAPALTPSGT